MFTEDRVTVSPLFPFFFLYLADFSPNPTPQPISPSHRSSSTFQPGFSRILSTAGNGRGDDPLNRIRLIQEDIFHSRDEERGPSFLRNLSLERQHSFSIIGSPRVY